MTRQCRAALEKPYDPGYDRCSLNEGHGHSHTAYGGWAFWNDDHARHILVPLEEDEVVERMVAWLRGRATKANARGGCSDVIADAIERGEWKATDSPSNPDDKSKG